MFDHRVHHLPAKSVRRGKMPFNTTRFHLTTNGIWGKNGISSCSLIESRSSWWEQDKATKTVKAYVLPVDPARTSIRFDVHLIQVDINLGDFHLEAVGQKLDGLPDGAIARSPWQRKQGLGSNISFYDAHTKTHLLNRQNDLEILQKVTFFRQYSISFSFTSGHCLSFCLCH